MAAATRQIVPHNIPTHEFSIAGFVGGRPVFEVVASDRTGGFWTHEKEVAVGRGFHVDSPGCVVEQLVAMDHVVCGSSFLQPDSVFGVVHNVVMDIENHDSTKAASLIFEIIGACKYCGK